MELTMFLELLTTTLAGVIAWWLIDHIKWFATLQPDTKRYVAYGFAGVLALVGWFGLLALGERPVPVDTAAWIKQIFYVATTSFGLSTMLNGPSLRKYRTSS